MSDVDEIERLLAAHDAVKAARAQVSETRMEMLIKRVGWLVGLAGVVATVAMWVFNMGQKSTTYITAETRAKDQADQNAVNEAIKRDLFSLTLRATVTEGKIDTLNNTARRIEESVKTIPPAQGLR